MTPDGTLPPRNSSSPVKTVATLIGEVFSWTVLRITTFSVPLLAMLCVLFAWALPKVVVWLYPGGAMHPTLSGWAARLTETLTAAAGRVFRNPRGEVYAFVMTLMTGLEFLLLAAATLLGFLLCYALAAEMHYRLWQLRRRWAKRRRGLRPPEPSPPPATTENDVPAESPLAGYKRIGIILAGGGAKGAYQAGAMKAVYEFLEEHNSLHKVKMIAGTSIGSWNALFWLGGLVKGGEGSGHLQDWWSQINVPSVVSPVRYIPTRQNYLFSNAPWQKAFEDLFGWPSNAGQRLVQHLRRPDGEDAIHFYFTLSNIKEGCLDWFTNAGGGDSAAEKLPGTQSPDTVGKDEVVTELSEVRDAVFSSMGLPPLFPYVPIKGKEYEDGGVVDNLPIRFAAGENCDLLFILPLNASFVQKRVSRKSIVKRLMRVTNVRQGVLERDAFRTLYLFNELADLRDRAEEYRRLLKLIRSRLDTSAPGGDAGELLRLIDDQVGSDPAPDARVEDLTSDERALTRRHQHASVFSICPAPELIINTVEFWKTADAGKAFQFMYDVTRQQLRDSFKECDGSDWLKMLSVDESRAVTVVDKF